MSKHKFTGDRSEMAHQIKKHLGTAPIKAPPPVLRASRVLAGYDKDNQPIYLDMTKLGE